MRAPRERTVVFRLCQQDYQKLRDRAAAQDMSVSQYIRVLVAGECCPLAGLVARVEELEQWRANFNPQK